MLCLILFCFVDDLFITSTTHHANIYIYIYVYVPDEGSLLPYYRDCTTSNDFESFLMCCGVMLQ